MRIRTPQPISVVSPKIYAAIGSSSRLKRMLLPEGLIKSPYEILNYESTLTLHDPRGMRATVKRRQEVRFLQEGVAGILDHVWGDGVTLTYYHNDAGKLADSFRDEGCQPADYWSGRGDTYSTLLSEYGSGDGLPIFLVHG
ncbi:MAG: hypothetical protein EPO21_21895 [Chloroflexota bacterium]|nr:MAG: hypothetical protein EPO21_21895 [Chloroflexota bacterium]